MHPFSTPENIRGVEGVERGWIGNKWVKRLSFVRIFRLTISGKNNDDDDDDDDGDELFLWSG